MAQEDYRQIIVTYVGATGRTLTFNAKDEDGDAYDLTGVDTATLSARRRTDDGTVHIAAGSMTIVSPASGGVLTYTPVAGDVDTAGEMDAQITLNDGAGALDFPEPFIIDIRTVIAGS